MHSSLEKLLAYGGASAKSGGQQSELRSIGSRKSSTQSDITGMKGAGAYGKKMQPLPPIE